MFIDLLSLISLSLGKNLLSFFGYLNNNVFPAPLKEQEEAYYLEQWKKGDESARNVLVEHNLRLVAHIAKKFENTNLEKDDLISIGTIGLIKAINSFAADKGTKLATYSARCIENEILMYLRATKNVRTEVFLQDPVGVDKEGNEVTLLDLLGTDGDDIFDHIASEEEKEILLKRMVILSTKEKYVLSLRYGLKDGIRYTQRQIAQALGISRSYVSRIEKKAIEKLIKNFPEN